MHRSEAKRKLIDLFNSIGWEGVVEEAFAEECRNAYLHGFCDSAFELKQFTLRDYWLSKEAIAALGNDRFADEYEQLFGKKLPANTHLL